MICRRYNCFTMCAGLGGGAKGFKKAVARVGIGNMTATWRCIGGIDNNPAAARDFHRLVGHWKRYRDGGCNSCVDNPIASYASLWTEINGAGSREENRWVWVVEFRRT